MRNRTANSLQAGFTLYELMITLAIAGMVLSFGMSNLTQYTKNSRMTATANGLHAAFFMARSESSRGKTNITVCASATPTAANSDCDGTWDQGYIVFIDTDGDLARAGVTETILRSHDAIESGVTLRIANGATYFSFASSGLGRGDVNGVPAVTQIVMCDDRGNVIAAGGNSAARLFVATPLGRATILRDMTRIDTVLTAMGMTCP
jgi:type IV fimbrial biogenesis protein FimT